MKTYMISEAARATGFTESALRYYEMEGVVTPARTDTGYRNYRDEHLDALRFVARGKQLGLSLDDIKELLNLLGEEECEPVQTRIRHLVGDRIDQAHDRIAELVEFTGQLQRAAAKLGVHTPDGACDDECGCVGDPPTSPSAGKEKNLIPLSATSAEIACSLHADQVGGRIDDWMAALATAIGREWIPGGVRVQFDRSLDVAGLAELAAAEQSCCSFFEFGITIGHEAVALEVTGPDDAQDVIASVFGAAA